MFFWLGYAMAFVQWSYLYTWFLPNILLFDKFHSHVSSIFGFAYLLFNYQWMALSWCISSQMYDLVAFIYGPSPSWYALKSFSNALIHGVACTMNVKSLHILLFFHDVLQINPFTTTQRSRCIAYGVLFLFSYFYETSKYQTIAATNTLLSMMTDPNLL